jgi:hypothetical protein
VLGIAIAFIIGAFTQVKEKFNLAMDNDPFAAPADSSTPIKFEKETLSLKAGSDTPLILSIYNTGVNSASDTDQELWALIVENCADKAGDPVDLISISKGGFRIPYGESKAIKTFVHVEKLTAGQYVCTIKAGPGNDADPIDGLNDEADQVNVQIFIDLRV